jgi:hypothetical protein
MVGGRFFSMFLVVALAATKARISSSDAMVFGRLHSRTVPAIGVVVDGGGDFSALTRLSSLEISRR